MLLLKNTIKTFSLFVKPDSQDPTKLDGISNGIANSIRKFNSTFQNPLEEVFNGNGDLIIAVGGDGTFLHSVTSTKFCKSKVYAGVHTGTLGFLQNISADGIFGLITYIHYENEISTRKMLVSSVTVNLSNNSSLHYHSLNEVLIAGTNYSKISFAEYINDELLQNVVGNGIIIATNTGDTAYSMNSGGAIDFSNHSQLVCTLLTPIENASYERFIKNAIICSKVSIIPKRPDNISIIIDGIPINIDSLHIKSVDVSMLDDSNYINKFELKAYSKADIIRKKILGY